MFEFSRNSFKLVSFPSSGGIVPVKPLGGTALKRSFPCRSNCVSAVSSPKAAGIVPESLFWLNFNVVSFVSFPKALGIVPVSSFLYKSKIVRSNSPPKAAGIVPVSSFWSQFMFWPAPK